MRYGIAADAVVTLHLAFILFVVLGGACFARWRWFPVLHLPAAAWGIFVEISGGVCPLTSLENHLRIKGGQAEYTASFIEHYLVPIIYPAGLTRELQLLLAVGVLAINAALYGWAVYHRRAPRAGGD